MKLFLFISLSALMLLKGALGNSHGTDKQALLKFKSQVSEEKRVLLSSWNNSFPLCKWTGVTCGRKHKRVTGLDLGGFRLGGVISPFIGNLSFLISLDLNLNSFGGIIPQELGSLFRLQHLNMSFNFLGGGIPASLFNCSRLLDLDLHSNHLGQGLPSELGSLSMLVYLDLRKNNFKGKLPVSLGNLTSLRELSFAENNLEGEIPDATARLIQLYYYEPVTGRKFRSRTEVLYYLEHGTTSKKGSEKANKTGFNPYYFEDQGRNQSSRKAKEQPLPLNFDFEDAPEKVSWSMENSGDEGWSPFLGEDKVQDSVRLDWWTVFTTVTTRNPSKLFLL